MSIAVKSGLPSLGSTEGAVITKDDISVTEETSPSASVGEDLPRGKSAYEVAVENGFSGTETEWLASLKGATGAPGANGKDGTDGKTPYVGDNGNWYIGADDTGKPSRGAKGDKGEKGDKGDKGDRGEQGIKGEKGDRGEQGLKGDDGKDYVLTDEDLQKISTLVEVPTKTSELQNDSGYITADDAPPEVYVGSEEPQGNEVIWVDDGTTAENINATKAYVDNLVNSALADVDITIAEIDSLIGEVNSNE